MIPRDDIGIITKKIINDLNRLEADPKGYYGYVSTVESKEEEMWNWETRSREEDITALAQAFQDLFSHYPTLPIHLNGLFVKHFIRGFKLGEDRWKPNFTTDEPIGGSDGKYVPIKEDFN